MNQRSLPILGALTPAALPPKCAQSPPLKENPPYSSLPTASSMASFAELARLAAYSQAYQRCCSYSTYHHYAIQSP